MATPVPLATLLGLLLAQPTPDPDLLARWDPGAPDCRARPPPPLEVHQLGPGTFALRESLCATAEAPFLYLLVGRERALLIDTGDVADPAAMPLATSVLALLPGGGLPLLVVHTHGHLDHRSGDAQLAGLPGTRVVPSEPAALRAELGLADWPEGTAVVELGGRPVEVIPAPGHHPAHLLFYDRGSALLFSGDFLLPGRLLVDDRAAYLASARRVAQLLRERPLRFVLGAHLERSRSGALFPWGSRFHPDEAPLGLPPQALQALPRALEAFGGLYTDQDGFAILHPVRLLVVEGMAALLVLALLGWGMVRLLRRRRRRRAERLALGA